MYGLDRGGFVGSVGDPDFHDAKVVRVEHATLELVARDLTWRELPPEAPAVDD